jgi:DNA-directed RNA polymerase II subunit RPB2
MATMDGEQSRRLATELIHTFFTSQSNPLVRHHIDSYDQFVRNDIKAILKSNNPLLIYKNPKDTSGEVGSSKYKYKTEIYFGGLDGEQVFIGTPTIALNNGEDVRILYPNEARLRNLTYASTVYADIDVHVTYTVFTADGLKSTVYELPTITQYELFKIPIMLHSKYCLLHNKTKEFLTQAGECHYDSGGYFIVDGAEKVLITRQEQAFNTLYITKQDNEVVNFIEGKSL